MSLNSARSNKLTLIRFPLIALIVFAHSPRNISGDLSNASTNNQIFEFIMVFISAELSKVATLLFFLISGFLFFKNLDPTAETFVNKYKNRFHSLAIPYLFWNAFYIFFHYLVRSFTVTSKHLLGNQKPVVDFTFYDYCDAIGITQTVPIARHFWFIKVLIILTVLSPIIYWLIKNIKMAFLITLAIIWIFNIFPEQNNLLRGMLFFSIGAYFAINSIDLFCFDKNGPVITVLALSILAADALIRNPVLHNFAMFFGIPTMLYMVSLVQGNERFERILIKLSKVSFFIFCFHGLTLAIMSKLTFILIKPHGATLNFLLYFLLPIAAITFSIKTYPILLKLFPSFTNIIVGKRTETHSSAIDPVDGSRVNS